jgi:membrane fusion protein (multidrug efflux system)
MENASSASSPVPAKGFNYKKTIALALIFIVLALVALGYWIYSLTRVSTDDSYVNANVVQIAARVTGQVLELDVQNNQAVKKGDVLFRLDPAPFLAVEQQAEAQLAIDQANLANARATAQRVFTLVKEGVLSQQDHDDNLAKLDSAKALVALDQASLKTAQLNLQYTIVIAPVDGWVSNMSLRPRDTVNANEPQFALIASDYFWVDANFKETDLARIKVGAPAKIYVDMYPDHVFQGVVESVSGGSGNAFALLPPQNATGNWVKVTQRVPVKVHVLDLDSQYPLRVGTSAVVVIPTHE